MPKHGLTASDPWDHGWALRTTHNVASFAASGRLYFSCVQSSSTDTKYFACFAIWLSELQTFASIDVCCSHQVETVLAEVSKTKQIARGSWCVDRIVNANDSAVR